jgi:hypothetical protein
MRIYATGLMVLLFAVSAAQGFATPGTVMAEHVGDNDPATEMAAYWRSTGHPFYTWREDADPIPATVGPDPGPPANWSMVENDKIARYWSNQVHHPGDSAPYDYHQFLDPSGWVATILVKVNSAHSPAGHAVIFGLEDTINAITLQVVNNPGTPSQNGLYLTKAGPDTVLIHPTAASDWMLVNFVCDAKGNTDTADDEFSVYVDGILVDTYNRSEIHTNIGAAGNFTFGRSTPTNTGVDSDQQYALWRLEFGNDLPFPIAGDVDGDLWVGNKDLNLIIEHWGSTTFPDGDLDNSGTVDMGDYLLVVDNWGTGLIPPAAIPLSKAEPAPQLEDAEINTASLGYLLGGMLVPLGRRRRSMKAALCVVLAVSLSIGPSVFAAGEFTLVPPGRGGTAASWGDYDRDGDPDLYGGADIWENTGSNPVGWSSAGTWPDAVQTLWGDIDNDGFLDFYSSHENKVYMNSSGTVSMIGVSLSAVTSTPEAKVAPCFADFDNNGYIDLYIASHFQFGSAQPDALLMNSGTGWTTTGEEGALGDALPVSTTYEGRGATACDFDRDGDQDIYVSNYGGSSGARQANYLWINDGTGMFTESAVAYNVEGFDAGVGTNQWSIGSVWADFDNDGEFDLFAGSFNHTFATGNEPRAQFLKNNGDTGNPATAYHFTLQGHGGVAADIPWGAAAAGDYDNDGDLDLYLSQIGIPPDPADLSALYRNDGNFTFTRVNNSGVESVSPNLQGAWADYDDDGDLDLMANAAPHRNNLDNANHFLKIRLIGNGTTVNADAIGAQVRIAIDPNDTGSSSFIATRQVEGGTGANGNQNDMTLHFGLGVDAGPVDVNILWPDGRTRTIQDVAVDQLLVVDDTLSYELVQVPGAPAGYTAYDLLASTITKLGPMELVVSAVDPNKDGIFHVSQSDDPDMAASAIDTYVTIGTLETMTGPNPYSTFVLGNAEAIDPLSSMAFDGENINIAWAWDPLVDYFDYSAFAVGYENGALDLNDLLELAMRWLAGETLGPGENYQIARLVLSNQADVSLTLVGMRAGTTKFTILNESWSP